METPFVISEVGSNWTCFEDAKDSIAQSKLAGADAVKFQLFTDEELYGFPKPNPYRQEAERFLNFKYSDFNPAPPFVIEYEKFEKDRSRFAIPRDWIPKLKEKADACGIEFMATAFSPDGYRFIDPFVKRHKVASSEMCHLRILQTLRELGKPVILSTGAHTLADIKTALNQLEGIDVTVLYCEASYPASWVDLGAMYAIGCEFPHLKYGFSDHSTSIIEIPRAAADGYGANVIEKHFKLRDMDTPDNGHSLKPNEFKAMVRAIKGDYPATIGPTPAENTAVLKYKRRLIATRNIQAGETLIENENFGIFRSLVNDSHALHPFLVDKVNGKTAKLGIQAGAGIGPGDFE